MDRLKKVIGIAIIIIGMTNLYFISNVEPTTDSDAVYLLLGYAFTVLGIFMIVDEMPPQERIEAPEMNETPKGNSTGTPNYEKHHSGLSRERK